MWAIQVAQEHAFPQAAIPNGRVGEWNGGILMGVQEVTDVSTEPSVLADGDQRFHKEAAVQWTDAILPYADSGAHFMFAMRELVNFTTAAVPAPYNICIHMNSVYILLTIL